MSRRQRPYLFIPILAGALALCLPGCGRHESPAPEQQAAATPPVEAPEAPPSSPPVSAPAQPPVRQPVITGAAPAVTVAAEPEPPPTSAPTPVDLESTKPKEQPVDALQWLQDREARKADYQLRLNEAEANLAVAAASIADWDRTILAFENPYRPRPKLAAEDAQTVAGMDGVQRLHWAQGRRDAARAARDQAQKIRDELKANPPPD